MTAESTHAVRRILEENNRTCDIYERLRCTCFPVLLDRSTSTDSPNEVAHNHFPHSALTRYALGAPSRLLEDTWKHDGSHLVSLDPEGSDRKVDLSKVPKDITRDNWDDPAYLAFDGLVDGSG